MDAPTDAPADAGVLTPGDLNRLVERTLQRGLPDALLVRGEVSNFKRQQPSGHLYFSLKDADGCVDCVMWKGRAAALTFQPRDGQELLATGTIAVFVQRGKYQLQCARLEPVGEGALEAQKRAIEERLRAAGWLDPERRLPLPRYPQRVVVVGSPQAAGFADVMKVLRRCPQIEVLVYPVPVQGKAAAPAIAEALRKLNSNHADLGQVDVVLLGRGGGSLEDLWAFNDERVAAALCRRAVPVVTGIGHEIDVSIADLLADHHAHTPTEAASVIVKNWLRAADAVAYAETRLRRTLRQSIQELRARFDAARRHPLVRDAGRLLGPRREEVDAVANRLRAAGQRHVDRAGRRVESVAYRLAAAKPSVGNRKAELERLACRVESGAKLDVRRRRERVAQLAARLGALNPTAVLARGYTITTRADGSLVRTVADAPAGMELMTRASDGVVRSRVG